MGRVTLFLAGDVMTGRGIDQVLAFPSEPTLYESHVHDARAYVELAERANGPIPRSVGAAYVCGDMLGALERLGPSVRIANLETSVTTSSTPWPDKGIHYRMNPANVACLTAARLDCCVLANNHVLDWGRAGLVETLAALAAAGIRTAGAGTDAAAAARPAVIELADAARVLVFACGSETSGIPRAWRAGKWRAGVELLDDLSLATARRLERRIERVRRRRDVVVVSVHWGGNWGYAIPAEQREFAHALIDGGAADVVHGHSSHHAKGVEVYRGKPIIYGCGDFLNDYEGIDTSPGYRGDLALGYFVTVDAGSGALVELKIQPAQMRRFGLRDVSPADAAWLKSMLDREGAQFGTGADLDVDGTLLLRWGAEPAAGAAGDAAV